MRTLLYTLTLALYGFSAMELHEWVRVPQVLIHLLEHHSDLGHHRDAPAEHGHGGDEGHNPFGHHNNEVCGIASVVSLPVDPCTLSGMVPTSIALPVPSEMALALSDYSGSKWNPPKLV